MYTHTDTYAYCSAGYFRKKASWGPFWTFPSRKFCGRFRRIKARLGKAKDGNHARRCYRGFLPRRGAGVVDGRLRGNPVLALE